jgi:PAS domain S-box-containing protein
VNERLCEVVGYSRDELLALAFQDLTHPDDHDADLVYLRQLLSGDIESVATERRCIRKDLKIVWVNLTTGPVRDSAGTPAYFICVVEDISKRKRAEAALAEKQRLLEELNKSLEQRIAAAVLDSREKDRILMQQGRQAAMGEMIGNIAHQWRQPLNTLGLIVQELRLTYGRDEFSKESLDASVGKAMELISHMSQTIEDFRNYFKPEKEKMLFDVNQAVVKTLSLIEPSLKSMDIKVQVIELDRASIDGYAKEYSQVLLNILLNCRDAFEGCSIERERVVMITISKENNRSVVTVADSAGGIPEDIVDKIFDPYFTTKGPDKGTGIGLYMAKTIIEKNMGGRLTVRNTADGAEFRIEV